MRVRPEGDVEGVSQTRIGLVLLDVDLAEGMFPVGSEFPGEAQHLRGILVGVGDVEVPVRPEDKPPQLTQIEVVREGMRIQRLPQRLAVEREDVDVVPRSRARLS